MTTRVEDFKVRIFVGTDVGNGYLHNAVMLVRDEDTHLKEIYVADPEETVAELINSIPNSSKLGRSVGEGDVIELSGTMNWDGDDLWTETFVIKGFRKYVLTSDNSFLV